MHHSNHFYGHAHILAAYCGLNAAEPPRIEGYLQHGWSIGTGLSPTQSYIPGSPIFLWSDQIRRRAWSSGFRNTITIGSPWVYLLSITGFKYSSEKDQLHERSGTIFYPFHGYERQAVIGSHDKLVAEILDNEVGPVTVCLYWQEYHMPSVRRVYEQAGFRVICHGYRGWRKRNTDRHFLYKQLAELLRHRRVASNRLSTAIFYGVAVGCEPAVYGDPMVLEGEDAGHGGQARIRRQWPELHGVNVDLEAAREITAEQLGFRYRAEPDELRELLGWSKGRDRVG